MVSILEKMTDKIEERKVIRTQQYPSYHFLSFFLNFCTLLVFFPFIYRPLAENTNMSRIIRHSYRMDKIVQSNSKEFKQNERNRNKHVLITLFLLHFEV